MSKEPHGDLPGIDAYLARIGIEHVKEPDAAFLDELIYAHQLHVPFENLDVSERGLNPSLDIADVFDKIVTRERGGYCFELNAAFAALLRALGFDVRPCMARVLLRPDPRPLISHRANIVSIEGNRYLADVGFGGPMPTFAPLLEEGATRTEFGHTFTMRRHDHSWWDVGYQGSKEAKRVVLRICTMHVEEHDFIPLSFYQALNPHSVFRLNRMVNIKTENGARDVRNRTYTEYRDGEKTVREIESEEEMTGLLRDVFGIRL